MPVVVTWDPSKDFKHLEKELYKNFVRHNCATKSETKEETTKETTWKPTADIYSEAEHYIISVDLPGVSKENISLTFEKGILTLRGERIQQQKEKTVRNEKQFGAFERKFKMTTEIQSESITAEFSNGELLITVPKKASEERVITISNN
ncbi:MAG: Hsp20/alpha crystallin family protein [Candidatus Kapabacteria bacterium]|nr:Hsp20/alpha crystallin family protein [Candidatus Kapabacteria bacterium]